jgi:hypothetical protein
MEPTPEPLIVYTVRSNAVESDGSNQMFVRIFPPEIDPQQGVTFCVVDLPFLFSKPKRIAGADKDQAITLAKKFVADVIKGSEYELERPP